MSCMDSTDVAGQGGTGEADNEAESEHGGIGHLQVLHRTHARALGRRTLDPRWPSGEPAPSCEARVDVPSRIVPPAPRVGWRARVRVSPLRLKCPPNGPTPPLPLRRRLLRRTLRVAGAW